MSLEIILSSSGSSSLPSILANSPSVITAFLLKEDLRLLTKFAVSAISGRAITGCKTY